MHVENPQNEKGGLYTYKTPKSKKAVYTRIKHQNRKRKFVHIYSTQILSCWSVIKRPFTHVENTQNEKGVLYTFKTPNSKKVVYTRRKPPNRKRRFIHI